MRALFILFIFLPACATYQQNVSQARDYLSQGEADRAIKLLEPLAKKEGDDQLVYLFDYATALQAAGRYKESNDAFLLADKLSDIKNYLSISKFGASILLSEEFQQYKGEDYERLLINFMMALNFLMLNDNENALVEVRRLNEKLEYYRLEEKKSYEQNTAALYLGGLLWEADKDWDSAYISYERAYQRDSSIGWIKDDLVRLALKADRAEQFRKWSRQFNIKPNPIWKSKDSGEVVLIYLQGWGPRKVERPRVVVPGAGFISPGFPMLVAVSSYTQHARLVLSPAEATPEQPTTVDSEMIYSVQDTSIKALEDAYAPLIAKRIAGFVAKSAVSNQVAKKNEGLGALLQIALEVTDRADLRQWSTLPATIQVARLYLKAGKYNLQIKGLSEAGAETGEDLASQLIEVKPQGKTFIAWRSFK